MSDLIICDKVTHIAELYVEKNVENINNMIK